MTFINIKKYPNLLLQFCFSLFRNKYSSSVFNKLILFSNFYTCRRNQPHFLLSLNIFRQHAASIYGFVRKSVSFRYVCQKKFVRPFVGLHCGCVPPCENMCVHSLGYIGGASSPLRFRSIANTVGAPTPPVCPFIGRQSSLDHCMLPPPLWGILSLPGGIFKMFAMWNL